MILPTAMIALVQRLASLAKIYLVVMVACSATAAPTTLYHVQLTGTVKTGLLRESSGLAQSSIHDDVFWSHNDSGFGPYLFAFSLDGTTRARYYIDGVSSRDWEDMASFSWRDRSWLLVADIGDNGGRKKVSMLYLIEEPLVDDDSKRGVRRTQADRTIHFVYAGGPADCEAVAVDAEEGKIYLLTKRQRPPRLYSLPLDGEGSIDKPLTAQLEGEVDTIPQPTARDLLLNPAFGMYSSQPTSMDFSPQGSFAVVGTYRSAYRFDRPPGMSWIEAMKLTPLTIRLPAMKQSEAITVVRGDESLLVTSEGVRPPLYLLTPAVLSEDSKSAP